LPAILCILCVMDRNVNIFLGPSITREVLSISVSYLYCKLQNMKIFNCLIHLTAILDCRWDGL
jgi:hypothetical protein